MRSRNFLTSILSVFALASTVASAAAGGCVLGGVGAGEGGERRFSIKPNDVCIIQRRALTGMSYVDLKVLVRPKLGSFAKAGLDSMAYRSGARPGEDYFEYDSVLNVGGQIKHSVIRNYVTITP